MAPSLLKNVILRLRRVLCIKRVLTIICGILFTSIVLNVLWNNNKIVDMFGLRKHMVLTYDNPSTYKGPIVQGWPPSQNRSVGLYMEGSFSIIPIKEKLTSKELIVIVQTRPAAFNARRSIRETWATKANSQTSVLFIIGLENNGSNETEHKISEENSTYGDLIQVPGLFEHYDNLTLKTLYTMKFFLQKGKFFSITPRYLMKVDDDVFVNLPKLYRLLVEDNIYSNVKHLLIGNCFCNDPKPLQVNVSCKFAGRWEVPSYMYNGTVYPSLLSGSGYVLTRSAAQCMYAEAIKIPYFHLEDVHVTGFAADACNIDRRHHPGFYPAIQTTFDKENDILIHYVNKELMSNFTKELM